MKKIKLFLETFIFSLLLFIIVTCIIVGGTTIYMNIFNIHSSVAVILFMATLIILFVSGLVLFIESDEDEIVSK